MHPNSGNDSSGKMIGPYQVGNCIGRGAFASVYRALNTETGQIVAIKQFDIHETPTEEMESLMGEARLLSSLQHPNVVTIFGIIITELHLNIILELIEAGSLQSSLKQFGSMSEKLIAVYLVQILKGLQYLHDKGVVHCDIKCGNILSTKMGDVKLTDFGVSKYKSNTGGGGTAGGNGTNSKESFCSLNMKNSSRTVKSVVGTPYWMAPEVIQLEGASFKSDIWSLGCTVLEMLTGSPPYFELPSMSAMFHIVEDVLPPIPSNISNNLSDFLKRCFVKDPMKRATASELLLHPFIQYEISKKYHLNTTDLACASSATDLRNLENSSISSFVLPIAAPISPTSSNTENISNNDNISQLQHILNTNDETTSDQNNFTDKKFDIGLLFESHQKLVGSACGISAESALGCLRALGFLVTTTDMNYENKLIDLEELLQMQSFASDKTNQLLQTMMGNNQNGFLKHLQQDKFKLLTTENFFKILTGGYLHKNPIDRLSISEINSIFNARNNSNTFSNCPLNAKNFIQAKLESFKAILQN